MQGGLGFVKTLFYTLFSGLCFGLTAATTAFWLDYSVFMICFAYVLGGNVGVLAAAAHRLLLDA
ncbi:hypothetical protein jaqu_28330 [Jannaschia aquimarina]|uniref:Uncharacterized protein n=1 Tax=Jannaschia aquimarina TaxID=935700 RepID=A0A0D1ECF4_9RHOB|nr:hypothetical protein jaqu_28330 [Jannaschia aquimarina]SNT22862.1 hypothetical protein SAMN05421775_10881 [Jannaschia aquimarina]